MSLCYFKARQNLLAKDESFPILKITKYLFILYILFVFVLAIGDRYTKPYRLFLFVFTSDTWLMICHFPYMLSIWKRIMNSAKSVYIYRVEIEKKFELFSCLLALLHNRQCPIDFGRHQLIDHKRSRVVKSAVRGGSARQLQL